ncbi:hypothetical protein CEK62_09420 [Alcanivorax sp. N3-2A]|nr:hypothetical protein CEK62_09420 [Alcanivorax sp. N3-2A]
MDLGDGQEHSPVRDWSKDIWGWSPEDGPWTPDHGLPAQCLYLALATSDADHRDGYDFWRQTVFYDFEADTPDDDQKATFQARAAGLVGPESAVFWYRSNRLGGHRGASRCRHADYDDFTLGLVLQGQRRHRLDSGEVLVAGPGDLFVYDPTRPCRVNWSDHRGIHLTLPRQSLLPLFALDRMPFPLLLERLRQGPMSAFLRSHLMHLALTGGRLSATHQALLLEQTRDLAIAALSAASRMPTEEAAPDATYLAARRLMARRLDDPDLDPAGLARALGCSRATLYRLFSRHGVTVAGCLREARLRKAHRLLTSAPQHITIAELAARCGFLDQTGFSRLFRQRFGLRPSDLRRR